MSIVERKYLDRTTRRKMIFDSAAGVFNQKGFADATMIDIATRAQIAVGTIYLYFKSKPDIYFSLTKPALENLSNRLKRIANNKQNDPDVKIKKLLHEVEAFYFRNRDAYNLLTRTKASEYIKLFPEDNLHTLKHLMRFNFRQMEIVIEEGILKGLYKDTDPHLVAIVFWNSFVGIIQFQENRAIPGKKNYRKETTDLFFETLMAGLRK
jgi:AcrR family transcriptional regulator